MQEFVYFYTKKAPEGSQCIAYLRTVLFIAQNDKSRREGSERGLGVRAS